MPQTQTTIPTKNTGDSLTSSEFNEVNDTLNANSNDAEPRLQTIETDVTANESKVVVIEDTDTSDIKSYDTGSLPSNLTNGTIVYDTSMEVPVYTQNNAWFRASDDAALSGFTEVDMFIVMGQSNADGKADFTLLDSQTSRTLESLDRTGTLIHNSSIDHTTREYIEGTWGNINPGTNTAQAADRFGPELGFTDTIKATVDGGGNATFSNPIAIMKFTKGATDLGNNWDSPSGDCYTAMIQDIPNSKYDLGQLNYKFNIRGMIWYQGESDAGNLTYATNYETNLNAFIADVRVRFNTPNLPIILCKIGYTAGNEPTYYTEVRDALQAVSDNDSNIDIIDTEPYDKRDTVHLNAKGMYELGEAIVPLMQALL